jgi:hypothetical protein
MKIAITLYLCFILVGCANGTKIGNGSISPSVSTSHVAFDTPRNTEEIEITLLLASAHMSSIFKPFRRKDPFLEGRIVIAVDIDSQGKLASCRKVENTIKSKNFEKKLLEYFCSINFGAKRSDFGSKNSYRFPFNFASK